MVQTQKIIDEITEKVKGSQKVVLQFPDGLKSEADNISKEVERKTESEVFIWMGSNFGGCDYPFYLEKLGFDLLINIGHNETFRTIT